MRPSLALMGWGYGDVIVWSYRHSLLPMRIVCDTEEELVVWLAPQTVCLNAVPADGKALRDRPLAERFGLDSVFAAVSWIGDGTLRIARRGASHSSWLFRSYDMSGEYLGWYGNLEDPLRRSEFGVHTHDHVLDLYLDASGNVHWKDEDEFQTAIEVSRFTAEKARAIRTEGERVATAMHDRAYPYDGSWLSWQPDPHWETPTLPDQLLALAGQPSFEVFPEIT